MPSPANEWWIWQGFVGIETAVNTGALFGVGQDMVIFFAVVSLIAVAGILYWVLWGGATSHLTVVTALGMIMGGILGNLYDRLGFWGIRGVRDWILLRYKSFTWPNFNIADSLLVIGAILLVWHAYRDQQSTDQPLGSDQAADAEPQLSASGNGPQSASQ